eukprot:Phypoly_transcript_11164.p1 GENE.Phypoly_transcript_11164~~Phypoly_transcript_11164.p1  ORF type:complete len:360 (+),score=61.90 Phypoly_transcript_11164:125-1204(+)
MSPKEVNNLAVAIGNLTTATSAVSDAAQKLEVWAKELVEKDERLRQLEERLSVKEKELQDKEKRLKEVEDRGKGYEAAVKKLDENTAKLGPVVNLNVGGQQFAASKNNLLKYKGSYFDALLLSNPQSNCNENIFIDRDPEYFMLVLNFLRDGKLKDSRIKSVDMQELREEFHFFGVPFPYPEINRKFVGGNLLSAEHKRELVQWLHDKRFALVYQASRDGFSAQSFHARCDIPGTVTVIQSEGGWLFGGYTSKSWAHTGGCLADESAFIFTLTNPHSIPPTKYILNKEHSKYAIRTHSSLGATFGGGFDIHISNNSNQNTDSYINFPYSYIDTTNKGTDTFTGAEHFKTKEIEVYSVSM